MRDVSVAAWLAPRLGPFGGWVGSVVPHGFASYARVLHPAEDSNGEPTTWAAVCAATGRRAHALMQWQSIVRDVATSAEWSGSPPPVGKLPPASLTALCRVLAAHMAADQHCFFALWEGYGWIHGSPSVAVFSRPKTGSQPAVSPAFSPEALAGQRLRHPGRDYLLFTGPLDAVTEMGWWPTDSWFDSQSPNLFWPADQSWCAATEIDFDSTLVAADSALITAILGAPDLEAWPVDPDDSLAINGDTINV